MLCVCGCGLRHVLYSTFFFCLDYAQLLSNSDDLIAPGDVGAIKPAIDREWLSATKVNTDAKICMTCPRACNDR